MDGVRGKGRLRMSGGIQREQGRGRGRGRPGGGVGHAQRRQPNMCNEIGATIVDHVM